MTALAPDLRKRLEKTVMEARRVAVEGAAKALEALAVADAAPHASMSADQRALRQRLRAHGRQLGDARDGKRGTQETRRLEHEIAYEHWHRMLFARFLAENALLLEPESGVAITLPECEEIARERGRDPHALAASFAEGMLPRIFRPDDPALAVGLPPETRQALQRLLAELPAEVFCSDDALGWTYQFWQSAEKDAVNERVKSGEKISGETLPAVTQLFTEGYMVEFLLDNTLGAWHAGKLLAERPELAAAAGSEQELRDAVALGEADGRIGHAFSYLRFVREPAGGEDPNGGEESNGDAEPRDGESPSEAAGPWRPATGRYPRWPQRASEIRVLDPCCGSGHFLVAAFHLLVGLRRAEEGLDLEQAIRAVLADNVFGLELDPRCTQVAAFNLAFAAWRLAGRPIELPPLQLACSGVGPNASKEDWLALADAVAGDSNSSLQGIRAELAGLHDAFQLAPDLGSLIDPGASAGALFAGSFETLEPLLDAIVQAEAGGAAGGVRTADDDLHERAVAARGMAQAARILVGPPGGYTLVVTNVPYLGRGSQGEILKDFATKHHPEAKADLATVFVARMLSWVDRPGAESRAGTVAVVTPQNWLFLTSYRKLRERLLRERTWNVVARLGPGAFETISGHVVNVALLGLSASRPEAEHLMAGVDVSAHRGQQPIRAAAKAALLRGEARSPSASSEALDEGEAGATPDVTAPADGSVRVVAQAAQLRNPDARIGFSVTKRVAPLRSVARCLQGTTTGDNDRFVACFWEVPSRQSRWRYFRSPADWSSGDLGCLHVLRWADGRGELASSARARVQGREAWGRSGVLVGQMSSLPVSPYWGELYDMNGAVIMTNDAARTPAVWAYCSSGAFVEDVRTLDPQLKVTNATFGKVPFDLPHWQKVAAERYPDGLPEPQSDDPTQWLFHGHPAHAEPSTTLQVAVARLLGYRWPPELDEELRLAPEARAIAGRCRELEDHVDQDGIMGLSAIQGEGSAADRLRSLLAAAFGADWSAAKERDLLKAAADRFGKGAVAGTLEEWLRDRFFLEHCKLFHARPFVWHVWDGLPGGFHALVSYHRLAGPDGEGRRTLEKLASTHLGEWIDRQRQLAAAGEEGAEGRLAAATALQAELRKILEGEPPLDLFVRWKPLHEQPIGWEPDLDDGVRLNLRPFLLARDVRVKNAGVLRAKPDGTWSNAKKPGVKDRGKEPQGLRPREHFPWFWGCDPEKRPEHRIDFGAATPDAATPSAASAGEVFDGVRWNGLHYSRAAKEAAREAAAGEAATSRAAEPDRPELGEHETAP